VVQSIENLLDTGYSGNNRWGQRYRINIARGKQMKNRFVA